MNNEEIERTIKEHQQIIAGLRYTLKSQARTVRGSVEALTKELSEKESMYQKRINGITKERDLLVVESHILKTELQRVLLTDNQSKELKEENAELKSNYAAIRKSRDNQITFRHKQVEELKETSKVFQDACMEHATNITALTQENKELKRRLNGIKETFGIVELP